MPCFFAASGIFAKSNISSLKDLGNNVWRRFRQLLIPMTCWQVLLDFTPPHSEINILKYLDCGSFWFLWALFFINALFGSGCLFSNATKVKAIYIHAIIAVMLLLVLVVFGYREHGFQYIAYYYPYYVLGYYVYRYEKIQSIKTSRLWVTAMCWLVLSLFWRMHSAPFYLKWVCIQPEAMLVTVNRYFVGIIAVIALAGLAKHYLGKETSLTRALTFCGTTSLVLYTIHVTMFEIGRKAVIHVFDNPYLEISLWFVAFLLVSTIITFLIQKNKWTEMILLGKIN